MDTRDEKERERDSERDREKEGEREREGGIVVVMLSSVNISIFIKSIYVENLEVFSALKRGGGGTQDR